MHYSDGAGLVLLGFILFLVAVIVGYFYDNYVNKIPAEPIHANAMAVYRMGNPVLRVPY